MNGRRLYKTVADLADLVIHGDDADVGRGSSRYESPSSPAAVLNGIKTAAS
jgi:hypothetical protein